MLVCPMLAGIDSATNRFDRFGSEIGDRTAGVPRVGDAIAGLLDDPIA